MTKLIEAICSAPAIEQGGKCYCDLPMREDRQWGTLERDKHDEAWDRYDAARAAESRQKRERMWWQSRHGRLARLGLRDGRMHEGNATCANCGVSFFTPSDETICFQCLE